jgi:hypothetical protein
MDSLISALSAIAPEDLQENDDLPLFDGYFLSLIVEPDDINPFDCFDCYGRIAWAPSQSSRPDGFDGSAEVIDRDRGNVLWWQPYREGKKVYNSPKDRRQVMDLLEYGLKFATLTLYGPANSVVGSHTVDIDSVCVGGLEPLEDPKDYAADLLSDIIHGLKHQLNASA